MNEEQLEPLLVVGRDALSQALRQWEMHANDARAALQYHALGKGDDMEDRVYRHGHGVLKRLGAAADEIEDAPLARKTAFDCSAWLALADRWLVAADEEDRLANCAMAAERMLSHSLHCGRADSLRACAEEVRRAAEANAGISEHTGGKDSQ